jgi:hypothetical protein
MATTSFALVRRNFYHALRDGRARMVEIVARKPD